MVSTPRTPAITVAATIALQLTLFPPLSGPNAPPLSQTLPYKDAAGKQIGTVTVSGRHLYIRNLKGEHVATAVIERDGSKTLYDPTGKILDQQQK